MIFTQVLFPLCSLNSEIECPITNGSSVKDLFEIRMMMITSNTDFDLNFFDNTSFVDSLYKIDTYRHVHI